MYIVGSSATLLSSGKGREAWAPILEQLSTHHRVLEGLPTTCQLHPDDEPVILRQPKDYGKNRPNGGCRRSCRFRFSCGHTCPLKCHPTDREHILAQRNCCEPCKRFPQECNGNHPCPKLCKDECGPCRAVVGPITLTCQHIARDAMCYQVHSQAAIEKLSLVCQKQVMHKFACGHEVLTACANSRSQQPTCPATCGKTGRCEHPCTKR